jgi:putative transposase
MDQARRLKELEKENARLKKLVAEQALDNAILREAARPAFSGIWMSVEAMGPATARG